MHWETTPSTAGGTPFFNVKLLNSLSVALAVAMTMLGRRGQMTEPQVSRASFPQCSVSLPGRAQAQ